MSTNGSRRRISNALSTRGTLYINRHKSPHFVNVQSRIFDSVSSFFPYNLYRFITIHEAPLPERRFTKTKNTRPPLLQFSSELFENFDTYLAAFEVFSRKIKSANSTAFGYTGCFFCCFFILTEKGLLSRTEALRIGRSERGWRGWDGSTLGGRARL